MVIIVLDLKKATSNFNKGHIFLTLYSLGKLQLI